MAVESLDGVALILLNLLLLLLTHGYWLAWVGDRRLLWLALLVRLMMFTVRLRLLVGRLDALLSGILCGRCNGW